MNKIIYGVVVTVFGILINIFFIKGPVFPFGMIFILIGFFLIWLGIIHKMVLREWIKWIFAAVLSIVTFYLLWVLQFMLGGGI